MRDDDRDRMTPDLERAIRLLREEPDPSPAWRASLDARLAGLESSSGVREVRVWTIRPWLAVAACLACILLGATAAALLTRDGVVAGAPVTTSGSATVRFTLDAPAAGRVALAGDFNAWNATSLLLTRAPDGRTWVIDIPLPPGRYAYAFVVDGTLASDPAAARATDDDFGAPSSVVLVRGS